MESLYLYSSFMLLYCYFYVSNGSLLPPLVIGHPQHCLLILTSTSRGRSHTVHAFLGGIFTIVPKPQTLVIQKLSTIKWQYGAYFPCLSFEVYIVAWPILYSRQSQQWSGKKWMSFRGGNAYCKDSSETQNDIFIFFLSLSLKASMFLCITLLC